MIHLKTFNKKQLEEFVSSGDFKKYDFLPITAHRAYSHINNPKANDDQTLLILAFDDDNLAGYIGCFPDHFIIDGKVFNYAWLSTLYVSCNFRGKRIAQSLLQKAFEEYHENLALTEFTKEAEGLYNKMGTFEYIQPKVGKRYYFRTDLATIIPSKKPKTKGLQPIFRWGDFILNSCISVRNAFIRKPGFKFEILDSIDHESADFVSAFHSNRNAEELNWAIENPWVLESKSKEEKYLFSSFAESFNYYWIKIYDHKNTLETCALLFVRDGHLKISYLFSTSDSEQFITFLSYFIVKNKLNDLTSYQTEFNKKAESMNIFPSIHQRNMERRYMLHKQFIKNLPQDFDPHFQDGDGDCVMT
ncbi:GNAT family N-acetyltransferase [Chryseobacterium sp. ERMR1:04]|uniref:GNAT family N-acetyltransferase n=1 Tax=Chryseobacterium sp. ERMR1:04 TaxID=1705393 RepID=UPI0006C89E68|nr:GNAT family N-acetyltransferase [Chryseobacterium sp. ERMR1:04]KPH12831.1 GNAT family acetyltransferase [Chryseobacterium sp. ERMR1:04]